MSTSKQEHGPRMRFPWRMLASVAATLMWASSWAAAGTCHVPEDPVAAAPTRPIETNFPDPVQTGVVQVESGWAHTFVGGGVSQDGLSSLIKLGAWCNTEIRWSVGSYNFLGGNGTSVSGMGDNYLTGHYRLFAERRYRPSTAVSYTVKFPSGDPGQGLGSGRADHIANLMLGKTVRHVSVVVDAFYFWVGQGSGQSNTKGELTLAISRPVWRRWSVTGEVYGDSRLNAANRAYANSTWVVNYNYSPRLIFDGGATVALTSGPGTPAKSAFLGVTYALGNLYRSWKR
jgi:hypothetical protein